VPTRLYCTNKNVDLENNQRLAELPGDAVFYTSVDTINIKGGPTPYQCDSLRQKMQTQVPERLALKVGAQVILLRNLPDENLANGSRGVVVELNAAAAVPETDPTQAGERAFSTLYAAVLTGIFLHAACSGHEITEWKRPGQRAAGAGAAALRPPSSSTRAW
jgi:hypothetical protein